ncbi:MAG: hypothetical protein D6690_08175 [Nitrospirae bacterium]|nr:MAG: hypothetical protein D6690_08175 [Nitrospirota bacterium]
MLYHIQHHIETLAHHWVREDETLLDTFTEMGVRFSPWGHDFGQEEKFWLAEATVEAENYREAWKRFGTSLSQICPKISFISQCYFEYLAQPMLIVRRNDTVGFIRYVTDDDSVGLNFMGQERLALSRLMQRQDVPDEFYFYWHDAVNAIGYSAKLLLMLAALEALVKRENQQKDWNKLEDILGTELKEDLWGKKAIPSKHCGIGWCMVNILIQIDQQKIMLKQFINK